jgi:hypothetical protein
MDGDGPRGAVECTSSALDARVAINDPGLPIPHLEYGMRAHCQADPAAVALVLVELEGHHVGKITESLHGCSS